MNTLGIDYGQIAANVESIKTARLNRESAQLDLDAKRKAAGQADNVLGLRVRAATGDASAVPELVALDPGAAAEFLTAWDRMSEPERAEAAAGIDMMGRAATFVLDSPDPARAYAAVLGTLPEDLRAKLPPEYNQMHVEWMLAMATESDKLIEDRMARQADSRKRTEDEAADIRAENRRAEAENRAAVRDAGLERETNRLKAEAERGAAGGLREVKASDSNALGSAAASLFGGVMVQQADGSYSVSGLAPDEAQRAMSVAALAESIWKADPALGHREAAKRAAERLGFTFGHEIDLSEEDWKWFQDE